DHGSHIAQAGGANALGPQLIDDLCQALPYGAPVLEPEVLDLRGALVGRAYEREHTGAARSRCADERLERVATEQRVHGRQVGVQPVERAEWGLQAIEQRARVRARA